MSKPLVLGNGEILVCLNRWGQVQDFYFPYIGQENQVGDVNDHRIGVMADGVFSWVDDSWEIAVNYQKETLVSNIVAQNNALGIELVFADTVHNETDIFLRNVTVKNLRDYPRAVKIFFGQHFQIYATPKRDTAYYDPKREVIIHYEGRRVFIVGARYKDKSFDSYSVGLMGIEGKEGTWKDAEDGELDRNAIEHGSVDSVIQLNLEIKAESEEIVDYWIAVAKTFQGALNLHDSVVQKTPGHLARATAAFWRAWVNKTDFDFSDIDPKVVDLFKRSLLVMRTHVSKEGGILASGDSDMLQYGRDTYAYVWLRDASFIVVALDKAKHFDLTRQFFLFCQHTLSEDGYFFHKYRSDESIGSSWLPWVQQRSGRPQLAIQEDETALVIWALWHHYQNSLDLEFVESLYRPLVKKAADFLVGYIDEKTGLPRGSYDIWEEKFGTSTFTSAAVFAGLSAAADFAKLLGKTKDEQIYSQAAEKMRKAIVEYLRDDEREYFYRMVELEDGQLKSKNDTIDASSFLGLFRFGILDVENPGLLEMEKVTKDKLGIKTPIEGIARYEGDNYYRTSPSGPGNPWFITTLCLAQYHISKAKQMDDLAEAKKWLNWTVAHALSSGILSEQLDAVTGEQLSAAPLTWSHAEFVLTVFALMEKIKELKRQ